jgi:TonB family protein
MNRLHKKCFIASAGTHLLLMLILFVGPAFLSAKNTKSEDVQLLDFIPPRTVDALVAPNPGGAPLQRQAQQQSIAPPPPVSKPPPAPVQKEQESAKVVTKTDADSLEVKPQKPRLPQVNTTLKTRSSTTKEKPTDKTDNREREAAETRRNTAAAIAHATANLDKGLSGSTSVRMGDGDGRGSGPAYANFLQALKTLYTEAWNVPDGADDDASISTSVTIARDGTVLSAHITRRSGNSIADTSVQLTLDRVRHAVPLPEDTKDDQRTVTITFSVKAKRLLG